MKTETSPALNGDTLADLLRRQKDIDVRIAYLSGVLESARKKIKPTKELLEIAESERFNIETRIKIWKGEI
jgi:hypothetical protein